MTRARVGARRSTSNHNIMYMCHMLHSLLGVFRTYYWDIATMIHLSMDRVYPLTLFSNNLVSCVFSSQVQKVL